MDVTPQELRGSEIKEAWRGFNRDEVDDLLERAAATIESLTREVHDLQSRGPVGDPNALPTNRDDADMLQRTLLLAQRAADNAVNEAQAKARKLLEESEARATALVSDAESTARRVSDTERRRLEGEIRELTRRRDQLEADADSLDEYVAGYRERVRGAIEADLDRLSVGSIEPPVGRPELHEVEPLPDRRDHGFDSEREPAPWEAARASAADAASEPNASTPLNELPPTQRTEWPPRAEPGATGEPSVAAAARADSPSPAPAETGTAAAGSLSWMADVQTSAPGADADAPAPWEQPTAEHQAFAADEPGDTPSGDGDDDLDDEAFFASLREAVRDEAPLGPRDDNGSFHEEEIDERSSIFRRRR
jgi:cell division septum initiation protein DivIVA